VSRHYLKTRGHNNLVIKMDRYNKYQTVQYTHAFTCTHTHTHTHTHTDLSGTWLHTIYLWHVRVIHRNCVVVDVVLAGKALSVLNVSCTPDVNTDHVVCRGSATVTKVGEDSSAIKVCIAPTTTLKTMPKKLLDLLLF